MDVEIPLESQKGHLQAKIMQLGRNYEWAFSEDLVSDASSLEKLIRQICAEIDYLGDHVQSEGLVETLEKEKILPLNEMLNHFALRVELNQSVDMESLLSGDKLYLLQILISELQLCRITSVKHQSISSTTEHSKESLLKRLFVGLQIVPFEKQITALELLEQANNRIIEILGGRDPNEAFGKRILENYTLNAEQREKLKQIEDLLYQDYNVRSQMMKKRASVTLQSFLWSHKGQENMEDINQLIEAQSRLPHVQRHILYEAFSAREGLLSDLEAKVSDHTISKALVKGVLIGDVPDRGGRVEERRSGVPQLKPRKGLGYFEQDHKGGNAGKGKGKEKGKGRGGRVQGGWGGNRSRGGEDDRKQERDSSGWGGQKRGRR